MIKKRVSLFLPCLADLYYPQIGEATIATLEKAGLDVDYPAGQTCCGQWAVSQGLDEAARPLARHFIEVFESSGTIVCPSASCVLTVTRHYPDLLAAEPKWKARAMALKTRVFELTDFLVNVMGGIDLGSECHARATLHDSCHPLRGLGLKHEPRTLLGRVQGLDLVEMPDSETCCGFGGAFMVRNPELSSAMVERKIQSALDTGADLLVMTEPGCLLNVDSALKIRQKNGTANRLRVVHLAEILAGKV